MAKPEKSFRVQYDLPASKLSTVVSLVQDEVSNLVIRDTAMIPHNNQPPPRLTKPVRKYAPRTGTMVVTVYDTLHRTVKVGDVVTYDHIKDLIRKGGWNATSHTSLISGMVTAGYAQRDLPGTIRIVRLPPAEK